MVMQGGQCFALRLRRGRGLTLQRVIHITSHEEEILDARKDC